MFLINELQFVMLECFSRNILSRCLVIKTSKVIRISPKMCVV